MNGEEMAKALAQALPEMRRILSEYQPPVVGSITRSGAVTILYDRAGSTHTRRKERGSRGGDGI